MTKDSYPMTPPPRDVDADSEKLWDTLNKITNAVNKSAQHTAKLPDIQKKMESMGVKVVELGVEMRGMGDRVSKMEKKVDRPHDCYQVDSISEVKDRQKDASSRMRAESTSLAETKAKLDATAEDVSNLTGEIEIIRAGPRRMFYGLIGMIFTVLTSVGGLLWFLAELSKDVEFERVQRTEQLKRLEEHNKQGASAIRRDIDELSRAVKVSVAREEDFDLLCEGMRSSDKRILRTNLNRRGKPVPTSCLE